MFKTDLSSKVGGNFSWSGQDTCSHFIFLFSAHLTSNSSENHAGCTFKIYPESDYFSSSSLLPALSESPQSFIRIISTRLLAGLPVATPCCPADCFQHNSQTDLFKRQDRSKLMKLIGHVKILIQNVLFQDT